MTESPQLLANVEFDIVKKGYDPAQVDNYLRLIDDQVGQLKDTARRAVEQAEVAHARAAEAQREKAAYLADSEQAKAELEKVRNDTSSGGERSGEPGDPDGTEALKKMLLLAQRTADSHVEEAQASAKNIVADARTKSAEIVAGAETRAERLLIEAQKVADELVRERSERIAATVAELERRRDLLRADSEVLERYLSEHRQRLQEGVTTLAALLNAESGLRADPVPALKAEQASVEPIPDVPVPGVKGAGSASTPSPAGPEPRSSEPETGIAERPEQNARESAGEHPRERSRVPSREPSRERPRAKADPTAPTVAANGSPTVVRVTGGEGAQGSGGRAGAGGLGGTATVERSGSSAPEQATSVRIPDLLETPSELRGRIDPGGGPPTEQIAAAEQRALLDEPGGPDVSGEAPLLPPVDPVTDEAMTRFFDDDLDADGKPHRFRRK